MADQRAIVQELTNRLDTLPPEQQKIVMELGSRLGVGPSPAKPQLPFGLLPDAQQVRNYGDGKLSPQPSEAERSEYQRYGPPKAIQDERFRNRGNSGQGLDEIYGALTLGAAKPALTAAEGLAWAATKGAVKGAAKSAVTGAASGYAVEKAANAMGLPKSVSVTAGIIAGMFGAGAASHVGEFLAETEAPTVGKFMRWMAVRGKPVTPKPGAFEPNPSTARKMRYGGPTEEEYSVPASGKTPAVRPSQRVAASKEEMPQVPAKFSPSKGVAGKMRYGGPAEEEYSAPASGKTPAVRPSQRIPVPEEQTPKAPARFTPSKTTAGRMRYGGPAEADYSAPSQRVGGRGRVASPAQGEAPAAAAAEPSPKGKLEAPAAKAEPAVNTESPAAGANSQTAKNARTVARKLKAAGMTPAQLDSLEPDEIAEYAKQIGLSPGNAKSLKQQALFELRKL